MRRQKNWTYKMKSSKSLSEDPASSPTPPQAQSVSFLSSTLNSFQRLLKVSSTCFNPYRGRGQCQFVWWCSLLSAAPKTESKLLGPTTNLLLFGHYHFSPPWSLNSKQTGLLIAQTHQIQSLFSTSAWNVSCPQSHPPESYPSSKPGSAHSPSTEIFPDHALKNWSIYSLGT